jgi:hypothetical protein
MHLNGGVVLGLVELKQQAAHHDGNGRGGHRDTSDPRRQHRAPPWVENTSSNGNSLETNDERRGFFSRSDGVSTNDVVSKGPEKVERDATVGLACHVDGDEDVVQV